MKAMTRTKWIVLGFALLLVAGLFAFSYFPQRGAQRELKAISAAGLPTSPAELDVWYRSVPAKENRALVIMEAAKLRVDCDPKGDLALKAGETLTPEMIKGIAGTLATNQPALELLKRLDDLPESRYPIDLSQGFATLLPNLAQIKSLAQLLRLQVVYSSHLDDLPEAVDALHTSFAVASSLRKEPLLISELVRIACVAITLSGLERAVSDHKLTHDQLLLLGRDLAEAELEGRQGLFRALVGERAIGLGGFKMSFAQLEQAGGTGSPSGTPDALKAIGYQLYRASGLHQRDLALYLEMMGGFVRSSQLEFPAALHEAEKVDAEMSARFSSGLGRLAVISRMLLPALGRTGGKEANLTARLRCAELALAVERFRIDHSGELPETVEQLVPKYVLQVPTDPFDGSALTCERLPGAGYRIVAMGASADQASRGVAIGRGGKGKKTEDVGFSVMR